MGRIQSGSCSSWDRRLDCQHAHHPLSRCWVHRSVLRNCPPKRLRYLCLQCSCLSHLCSMCSLRRQTDMAWNYGDASDEELSERTLSLEIEVQSIFVKHV